MKTRNSLFNIQGSRTDGGFTLVELLVSITLFIILVAVATGIFVQTLRTQRIVTQMSESLNNVSLAIEQMAREIRVGFNFSGGGSNFSFTNSNAENVTYRWNSSAREIERNGNPITAEGIEITRLDFVLAGSDSGDDLPPRVTVSLTVCIPLEGPTCDGGDGIEVNLQNTVSSRLIDS